MLLGTIDAIAGTTIVFLWAYVKLGIVNIKHDRKQDLTPLYGALTTAVGVIAIVEFLPGIVHFFDAAWNTVMGIL